MTHMQVAYGGLLDPEVLMEWFELQRLLGVDHIYVYDLGVPEKIAIVFKYYSDMGLLTVLPYELPGKVQKINGK